MPTPRYSKMASGNIAIVLDEGVDYDNFPQFLDKWVKALNLQIIKQADGPDARVCDCTLEGYMFWLSYDDWFPEISLEPQDAAAGSIIPQIGKRIGINESVEQGVPGYRRQNAPQPEP